jgi:hypothetical protein
LWYGREGPLIRNEDNGIKEANMSKRLSGTRRAPLEAEGWLLFGVLCLSAVCQGGELVVDGSLTVKTNLSVQGQLSGATLALTNLVISGQATIEEAVIQRLPPQGDLAMGPYTNRIGR